jgi:hypothetical protein
MKIFVGSVSLLMLLTQGCAPVTTIQPRLDAATQAQELQYVSALPRKSGDSSADVLFRVDRETGKLTILQVANNGKIARGVVDDHYRNNIKTEDDHIVDCITLGEDSSNPCTYIPDNESHKMLSGFYSREYTPFTGFLSSAVYLPLQIAFAIPISILSFDLECFRKIDWPTYSKLVQDGQKRRTLGRAAERTLMAQLHSDYQRAYASPDPGTSVQFLNEFPRYAKTPDLKASLPAKYRRRGSETGDALDFLAAYKLTNDRSDIQAAQKYAKDNHARAEVEGTLVSGFPNKHKLVTATVYNDNLKGSRQSSGANVFIMNIGASAIKNAEIGVKLAPAGKSPIPFQYANYKVKLKCNLKLSYSIAAMGAATNKVENRTQQEEVILRKDTQWKGDKSCSFGEIVQSGGGSLFGFKYMDIHLTGAEASAEIVDVQPI